ncbi:hypothetical protein ACRN9C_21015 [Shewanella frigidimarina]|uniref:hypothetical protein n=1 Tax=Shewanella frigidimarina TaxID=56812 RepID=UPI003D78D14D
MKIRVLAFFAKLMGIQFKIDGFPYGATKSAQVRLTNPRSQSSKMTNLAEGEQQKQCHLNQ